MESELKTPDRLKTSELLAQRAVRFRQEILDVACGPGGMIIAFLPFDTRKPFQEGAPLHWYLEENFEGVWGPFTPRPTVAEWYYGENTLWVTGAFLWSQILRYRVTQEQEALDTARKCFRDLNNIFRLCREIEPGLLGKPHGGRAGATTSYDQAAIPVLPYVMFAQELATPEEKAEATHNMALHGDYFLRRNWVMNHHGHLQRIVDPAHTSTMKYLACVHAAYEMTGETRFRDAAFKYVRQINDSGRLPWPTNPYELNHNPFYYGFLADYWLKTEIAGEIDWVGHMREYWQATQMGLDERGLMIAGLYDAQKRTFTPRKSQWVNRAGADKLGVTDSSKMERRWVSATSFPGRATASTDLAILALIARSHGLDDQAHQVAQRTLLTIDEDHLRWWWADNDNPPELSGLSNMFAPEAAANWLVVYWMGRAQHVW
ncbi:MAG: hypothetical protein EXR62_15400 [Chloroflexi bacterium]|nr:hypothetical protein [Chloroflexota bacterium]